MQAGDIGIDLQIPTTISLAGATCSLTVLDPRQNRNSLALTVGTSPLTLPDGTSVAANFWAHRLTLATDFPVNGNYQVQLVVAIGGSVIQSPPFVIAVGPKL